MKSDAFEARIQDLLDRREPLASDPELMIAASESDDLRVLLASYVALFDGVKQMPAPVPDAGLTMRIQAALAADAARPAVLPLVTDRRWRLGAAAAILLATGVGLFAWRERADLPAVAIGPAAPEKLAAPIDRSAPDTAAAPTTSPAVGHRDGKTDQKVIELGMQYAAIARQAMTALSDLAVLGPTLAVPPPQDSKMEPAASDSPQETNASLVDRFGVGLTPLASSTAGAFDFLFEVLPHPDARF